MDHDRQPVQPPTSRQKVFAIGLARTGTTSLHRAFEILGLNPAPTSVDLMDDIAAPVIDRHGAFSDNPIPFIYRDLDQRHPGSRFVMTTRPLDEWLGSMEWLFGPGIGRLDRKTRRLGKRVHKRLYGITRFDAAVLTDVYERHHDGIAEWFAGRDDLLTIELADLDWEPLCHHLGLNAPDVDFPHANPRT